MRRTLAGLAGLAALLVPTAVLARGFTEDIPADARDAYVCAERALIADDKAAAGRELDLALDKAPDYAPAYTLLKEVLVYNAEERAKVAARYRDLARANPDRAAYWYALGRLSTDSDERLAAFQKVVALAPDEPWGYAGLGLMSEIGHDWKAAVSNYEKARAMDSDEPSILAALAGVYVTEEVGRRADAAKLLDVLATKQPGTYWTEEVFATMGDNTSGAEHVAVARRYLDMYPRGRYTVWMNQVLLEDLASRDKAAAATRAREVIATLTEPRYADGRSRIFVDFIAASAASQGQPALDRLASETLASKEESPDIFLALADSYAKKDADHALGIKLAARALDRAQALGSSTEKVDRARLLLGRGYVWTGDAKQAVAILEPIASEEQLPAAGDALGEAYTTLGDAAKAFDAYTRAVAVEPTPERVAALAGAARASGRTDTEATSAVWAVRDKMAKPAAAFTYKPLDTGADVSLADYRGKVVLLDFWFPTCGPCRAEFPQLEELYKKYQSRGFEIVAVDLMSDDVGARKFLAEKGITFRSLRGDWQTAGRLYGVVRAPSSFVIDREGRVLFKHIGYDGPGSVTQLASELESVFGRPAK